MHQYDLFVSFFDLITIIFIVLSLRFKLFVLGYVNQSILTTHKSVVLQFFFIKNSSQFVLNLTHLKPTNFDICKFLEICTKFVNSFKSLLTLSHQ